MAPHATRSPPLNSHATSLVALAPKIIKEDEVPVRFGRQAIVTVVVGKGSCWTEKL
jgi:hypothetical protein